MVEHWGRLLNGLSNDPNSVADSIDWVAKRRVLQAFADRHGLTPRDPKLRAMDLQYHDLRPERSISDRVGLRQLVTEGDIAEAVTEPPRSTRAWFRGKCLQRFPDEVSTANWDSLVFDLGVDPLRRIPMMDPMKGTAELTEDLMREVRSAKDLVERLGN